MTAQQDPILKNVLKQSALNFPDGMPIVWYARKIRNIKQASRISGPSLMQKSFDDLCEFKHFFYGSSEQTLAAMKRKIETYYPRMNPAGFHSPPFRALTKGEIKDVILMLNDISPDIIWVALGAPNQERWMWEMRDHLDRGVMIGVGAAFDYFSDNIRRPPLPIRRMGLEWLCRLIQEPNRLCKRYLVSNSFFLAMLIKDLFWTKNKQ